MFLSNKVSRFAVLESPVEILSRHTNAVAATALNPVVELDRENSHFANPSVRVLEDLLLGPLYIHF